MLETRILGVLGEFASSRLDSFIASTQFEVLNSYQPTFSYKNWNINSHILILGFTLPNSHLNSWSGKTLIRLKFKIMSRPNFK